MTKPFSPWFRLLVSCVMVIFCLPGTVSGQAVSLNSLYYESPEILVPAHARYPRVQQIDDTLVLVYQRILAGGTGGTIRIEYITSSTGISWSSPRRLGPDIPFSGDSPPPIYSFAADSRSNFLAVAESSRTIRVYSYSDGSGFAPVSSVSASQDLASPVVGVGGGKVFLFLSQDLAGQPRIHWAQSSDGQVWSALQPFANQANAPTLSFNPSYLFAGGRHIVVYQGLHLSLSNFFQLFLQTSTDGITWSEPSWLSDSADELDLSIPPEGYDNQRPNLALIDGTPFLAWERRTQARNVQVYAAPFSLGGGLSDFPRPVSNRAIPASNPQLYDIQGEPVLTYFDNPGGNSRFLAALLRTSSIQNRVLSTDRAVNTFGTGFFAQGRFHVFWQNHQSPGSSSARIVYRQPDQQVPSAQISALNYQIGRRSNRAQVQYRILAPPDPSGIVGFSFSWSQDPALEPSLSQSIPLEDGRLTVPAVSDGEWYFAVRLQDGAGNWSPTRRVSYFLDNTAPEPVTIRYPQLDEAGYLPSNSFRLDWLPSDDPDLAGYAASLRYLGAEDAALPASVPVLPQSHGSELQSQTFVSRQNIDNGLWLLSVSAVDGVGNIGTANHLYFRLNKYIPVTRVFGSGVRENILGNIELRLTGRGFSANGFVEQIIADRDGQEPWDYQFARGTDYRVVGDTVIDGITLANIRSGSYRLRMFHSERGWYTAPEVLDLQDGGTVRYGNYTVYEPYRVQVYNPGGLSRFLDDRLALLATLALLGLALIATGIRMRQVVVEGIQLRLRARAVLLGLPREDDRQRRYREMKRQGISLGIKFTVLIVILVTSVVTLIALPLRSYFLTSQQQTLARGLEDRVSVLLESIASGAENPLRNVQNQTIELAQLILQAEVMEESEFVTVTAPSGQAPSGQAPSGQAPSGQGFDFVWATTDPILLGTVSRPEEVDALNADYFNRTIPGQYSPGAYELADALSPEVSALAEYINREAASRAGDIPDRLRALSDESVAIALDTSNDAIIRRREIDTTQRGLTEQLNQIFRDLAGEVQSIPQFSPSSYNPQQNYYLFYKPVLFLRTAGSGVSAEASYYQGMVRMGVSTALINEQIEATALVIQNNIVVFSLIAVIAGVAGALLLSLITIMPIRQLVRAVEKIRDTEDKAQLGDFKIPIRSKDELYVLSDVIQQMTRGLVKAAETNKELLFGKDVQKMFISLDVGDNNLKLTTGHTITEHSEFFGYYEGAKGVSGDYFYYQKINADTYAIIKCDVSGKGISAALIMVEVATLFLNFFNDWEKKQIQRLRIARAMKEGQNSQSLTELVYNINDLIAERQFTGKFAALNIALFNERTGEITYCNAGDNQIFVFREDKKSLIQSSLFQSPASGMFNSRDMPIQFKEEKDKLSSGDVLLLFTDGMEESKRTLRNPDGSGHRLVQEDIDAKRVPEDYLVDTETEELGLGRLHEIINAVENRRHYVLEKYFAPWEPEPLVFDFTQLPNSPENTVLAVVAVEKMFRLSPDPNATGEDRISIDKKIDDFLKKTLQQYSDYFHGPLPEDTESLYRVYSGIKEDEQYDDLTILAVKKL